jgi:hypothetical protein
LCTFRKLLDLLVLLRPGGFEYLQGVGRFSGCFESSIFLALPDTGRQSRQFPVPQSGLMIRNNVNILKGTIPLDIGLYFMVYKISQYFL